ncbi:MAG TPA: hypothetical protein VHF05_00485 [Candidatus Paceibacterota bacterium]|nr:hypothetical protein [Candidatus Paceibacterota bacterium]
MTFIEFTIAPDSIGSSKGKRHYFVGKDEASILADTEKGREFGFAKFESYRIVTEEYVRASIEEKNLPFLEDGINAVQNGTSDSYSIQ